MEQPIDRREFLATAAMLAAALPARAAEAQGVRPPAASFALDGNRVRVFSPRIAKAFQVLMIADTHLFVVNGIPQFVADANATGAYLQLELVPRA